MARLRQATIREDFALIAQRTNLLRGALLHTQKHENLPFTLV